MTSVENWGIPGIGHTEVLHSDVSTVDESVDSASCLVVGTANPSGINGKALAFASLPWGIWNVAETQASYPVFARFQRELHWMSQHKLHCKHGHYAPLRPHSDFAGAWTGVAQIAPGPIHPVPMQWQGASYQSGRITLSHFSLQEHSILGACVYAPPSGPTYRQAKKLSSQLLEQITAELVLSSSGPRFIAGDFNCDTGDLQTFATWRLAGWEEIQHLAEQRFSTPRSPTSKGRAIRDHLWISPELQQWLCSVTVDSDHFADHSILYGCFRLPSSSWWQQHWPMPSMLPWQHLHPDQLPITSAHRWNSDDMTASFAQWSKSTESALKASATIDIPSTCWGRGQTLSTRARPVQLVPVRPGRHGDLQPKCGFLNRAVHLWCRQLRRLQAYCQRAKSPTNWRLQLDQQATWRAIIQAHGFRDGFRQWWLRRPLQHIGLPSFFPEWPPPLSLALLLLHDFEANFRQFESWHFRRRQDLIQARHLQHNQVLTKQLKQGDFTPMTSLIHEQKAQVLRIDPDHAVQLSSPLQLHLGQQFTLNQEVVDVTPLANGGYKIDGDLLPAPGQTIVARSTCRTFQAMEKELVNHWTPIWQKHAGLALSHWNRILAFALRFMPQRPPLHFQWNTSQFAYLAQHFRKRCTRGPDAWSREDIAQLPTHLQADLVNMYQTIQEGANWPQQLVTGFVIPIRKIPEAEMAKHYRPIVLISFLYRLWATGLCRAYLPYLAQIIPPLVFGYVPGRRAEDIWYLLQVLIQSSFSRGSDLLGYNADLVKCFNTLPRQPILILLQLMGFPADCASAWKRALQQLERRFRIANHTGDPVSSCTGFPEGDPVSCIATLAFNMALDTYLQIYSPTVACPVFVDNIQLVADRLGSLCHGVNILQVFMDAWDIQLDPGKCYAWATSADDRHALRSFGYSTRLAAKDLGAQMVYSKVSRTQVAQGRIAAASEHWQILRASSAPRWAKLLAIRTITWPKILHGVANRLLPLTATDHLRSAAMRALGWDRAGASPHIRWSLMQVPLMDPEFQQLWQVLSTFWRMVHQFPLILDLWLQSRCHPGFQSQGPLHVVEQCLGYLDWHIDAQLYLWIQHLRLSFWTLSLESLQILLQHSWRQIVCRKVRHRKDFAGFSSINWEASFRALVYPQMDAAELLATVQDGTFFTSQAKAHFDGEHSGLCCTCQVPDTVTHRALHCPDYQHVRLRYPAEVRLWPQRSVAFTHHGLHPANPLQWDYWGALLSLPDRREEFLDLKVWSDHTFIFTDGSCSSPRTPSKALAAWAVTTMEPPRTLAQGPVPGLVQSIDVAETMAVHAAFLWVLRTGGSATIFTDSQYAFDNFRYLQTHDDVPARWKHQVLWQQAHLTVKQIDPGRITLQKISSHLSAEECASPSEDWTRLGNDFVDQIAKWQNQMRPPDFQQIYQAFCLEEDRARNATRSQQLFLMELAQTSLNRPTESYDPEVETLNELSADLEANDASLAAQFGPEVLSHQISLGKFSARQVGDLVSWLTAVDLTSPHKCRVTLLELVVGFALDGYRMPFTEHQAGGFFLDSREVPCGVLIRPTLATELATFSDLFSLVTEHFQLSLDNGLKACPHLRVFRRMPYVCLGWGGSLASRVSSELLRFTSSWPIRYARDLARPR